VRDCWRAARNAIDHFGILQIPIGHALIRTLKQNGNIAVTCLPSMRIVATAVFCLFLFASATLCQQPVLPLTQSEKEAALAAIQRDNPGVEMDFWQNLLS
jgi:hypothetical protein